MCKEAGLNRGLLYLYDYRFNIIIFLSTAIKSRMLELPAQLTVETESLDDLVKVFLILLQLIFKVIIRP
jgi:hypothetical protein